MVKARFLGFVLTIFTNGGIGSPLEAPDPNFDPARDLTQEWRLTIYSIVKELNAASFSIPSYTGRTAVQVVAEG